MSSPHPLTRNPTQWILVQALISESEEGCSNRTENVREQEDTQQQSGARSNTSVDEIFSMFKTYFEDRIEE